MKYRVEDRGYETPCHIWTGAKSRGYGQVRIGGRSGETRGAHVVVFEQAHGPVKGEVHHRCEQKDCVRLDHLEDLTRPEHRKRHAVTHCPHGHAYTTENTYTNPRGHRICRTCRAETSRRHRRRRKT